MKLFNKLLIFLLGMSISALIWGISIIFLQKTPICHIPNNNTLYFYRINLTSLFFNSHPNHSFTNFQPLKDVNLKAIYLNGQKSFIILEKNKKSFFINIGEKFKGYKLIKIYKSYVIFEKNNKKYKIFMKKNFIKLKGYIHEMG